MLAEPKSRSSLVTILTLSLALVGCGTTQGDRALSGGLLGAGTGAAIGSLTGNAGAGAVIGGAGGALVGALTSPSAINLGPPPWRTARVRTPPRYAYHYRRCIRYSPATGHCVRRARG